jgi:hypothetical protein
MDNYDLLVTAIILLRKSTKGNFMFAGGIPPLQWYKFEIQEQKLIRPLPNL